MALCGLLAISVLADGTNDKSAGDSRRGDTPKHARKDKSDRGRRSDSGRPGADSRHDDRNRPKDDNGSTPKPWVWNSTGNPGDKQGNRDNRDNRDNHPSSGSKTSINIGIFGNVGSSRDHNYGRDRDHGYRPPVNHDRVYYYPSHPRPYHYDHWVFDHRDPSVARRSIYFYFGLF
jgi:hypothetical protein